MSKSESSELEEEFLGRKAKDCFSYYVGKVLKRQLSWITDPSVILDYELEREEETNEVITWRELSHPFIKIPITHSILLHGNLYHFRDDILLP